MKFPAPQAAHSQFLEPSESTAARGTVVLLHGFTGVPEELQSLAEVLAHNGWRVVLPCLAGHGRDILTLRKTRAREWLADVRRVTDALDRLPPEQPCIIGGLSFGSLLALCIAGSLKRTIPKGLVLLAPPFKMRGPDWLIRLLSLAPDSWLDKLPLVKKHPRPDNTFVRPRLSFTQYPLGAVTRMVRVRKIAKSLGRKLSFPMLILIDPEDHIVDPKAIDKFMHTNTGSAIDLIQVAGGEHELTLCRRYADVATTVSHFMDELCPVK